MDTRAPPVGEDWAGAAYVYRHPPMAERRTRYLLVVVIGLVMLVTSALGALPHSISDAELTVFALVNNLGDVPRALAWAPMQLGNVIAVPVSTLMALITGRARLALGLAGAGMLAWVAAKGVKDAVERGRPGALVDDAVLRDAYPGGLGFPSGHAAIAAALVVVVWPHLHRNGRIAVTTLALLVGMLRVYVGAHLPLDIIGGLGLGLAGGGAIAAILGWQEAHRAAMVDR